MDCAIVDKFDSVGLCGYVGFIFCLIGGIKSFVEPVGAFEDAREGHGLEIDVGVTWIKDVDELAGDAQELVADVEEGLKVFFCLICSGVCFVCRRWKGAWVCCGDGGRLGHGLNLVRLCPFRGQRKIFFGQSCILSAAQLFAPAAQGALVYACEHMDDADIVMDFKQVQGITFFMLCVVSGLGHGGYPFIGFASSVWKDWG